VKTHQQYFWRHYLECHEASKHHLLKFVFRSPTGSINLGFTTKGRLAVVLIIPSSWGSQRAVLTSHQLASSLGQNGSLGAFVYLFLIFSFSFLFCYFFYSFSILAPNELKPVSKIF
jgi:preprotein translocase subunit SecY